MTNHIFAGMDKCDQLFTVFLAQLSSGNRKGAWKTMMIASKYDCDWVGASWFLGPEGGDDDFTDGPIIREGVKWPPCPPPPTVRKVGWPVPSGDPALPGIKVTQVPDP